MGPVNWLAVILAANLALALRIVWYGPLIGVANLLPGRDAAGAPPPPRNWLGIVLMLLLPAAMLGHMFARLSPGRPWLYFMMSGGVAVAFVVPALWLAYARRGIAVRETALEAGYWLVAYLAMGVVFWALG